MPTRQKSETFVIQWNSDRVATYMRESFKWVKINSSYQVPVTCPCRESGCMKQETGPTVVSQTELQRSNS